MTSEVVQLVLDSVGTGNTITVPKKKQCNPSKRWCFTLNNYKEGDIQLISAKCAKYIIGKEVGESGTPHLQGYIEFDRRVRPMGIYTDMPGIHWEKCRGSREDNIKYCSKDGIYVTNLNIDKPLVLLKESDFYPWQKWLFNKLMEPANSRTVYWIYDEAGNIGKSSFAKMMCYAFNGIVVNGKANDMFQGISGYKESNGCYPGLIFVDCPRHNIDYMNYGGIETIKNGHVFSGKYESKQMFFNPPHVVCFANSPPDESKFSADRWCIKKVGINKDFI